MALSHLETLLPLTVEQLENFSDEQFGFLELLTSRLGKLQDAMGIHIFPLALELLGERNEGQTMIDVLNRLEKLGFVEKASFWQELRKLRSEITHEYEHKLDAQVEKIHLAVKGAKELLQVWGEFLVVAKNNATLSPLLIN